MDRKRRAVIQWTTTARDQLASLPKKVRQGILAKADELAEEGVDPREAHKPLHGPLAGHYRITYARYRAVYSVDEEELANGDVIVRFRILFVAVGVRKERDKNDIYEIARRAVTTGIIDIAAGSAEQESPSA